MIVDGAIISQKMRKRNVGLSVVSGLLLAASMPKPGIWAMAWIGLVPLLIAIRGSRMRDAALYGLITGLVYYGIIVHWLTLFGQLPWALVVVSESLFIAVFALMAARLMQGRMAWQYVTVPAAWVVVQWVRCLIPYSFTWGSFAHTQANNLPIVQLSSITGPWGIEFLVCLVNLAITIAISRKKFLPAICVVAFTGLIWLAGFVAMGHASNPRPNVKVAIIQGNIEHEAVSTPESVTREFLVYEKMSIQAAKGHPDFIIWPETAIVEDVTDQDWGYLLRILARTTAANYVVGGYDKSENPDVQESYNSAFFYNRKGGKLGVYHKVHLVPFGEFVPLRDHLPWLKNYGIRDVDVLPGKRHKVIKTEIGKVGMSICFESLFPAISRIEAKNGASALFIITNDKWFGRTQAARQHMMMSKLRAVENRRYVVRAASTGVSAIIDPYGRTISELGIYRKGILEGRIAACQGLTIYSRLGDWFAYVCAVILIASVLPREQKALRPHK